LLKGILQRACEAGDSGCYENPWVYAGLARFIYRPLRGLGHGLGRFPAEPRAVASGC